MTSFKRCYELTFTAENGQQLTFTQTTEKNGLMLEFDITKSNTKKSNQAVLRITNPSNDTITTLQKEGVVNLKLGYADDIATVLQGEKKNLIYDETGSDKTVIIEVAEGEASRDKIDYSKNYGAGTTNTAIIQDLVSHIIENVPSVESQNVFTLTEVVTYQKPQIVTGNVFEKLDQMLSAINMEFFINKGVVTILAQDGFVKDVLVPVSSSNGLIGIPKPISDNNPKKKSIAGIDFESLLNYSFDVGRLVKVNTKDLVDRRYKIDTVKFVGNTYEGEFKCQVRGIEADGI